MCPHRAGNAATSSHISINPQAVLNTGTYIHTINMLAMSQHTVYYSTVTGHNMTGKAMLRALARLLKIFVWIRMNTYPDKNAST